MIVQLILLTLNNSLKHTMIGNGNLDPFPVSNDIRLRYRVTASQFPVDFLDIKHLRKNEKGPKNFFEGHIKDQIAKK